MTNPMLPTDFSTAVKDIKLAILQARARAAKASNAEALKLYFFIGMENIAPYLFDQIEGYVSITVDWS